MDSNDTFGNENYMDTIHAPYEIINLNYCGLTLTKNFQYVLSTSTLRMTIVPSTGTLQSDGLQVAVYVNDVLWDLLIVLFDDICNVNVVVLIDNSSSSCVLMDHSKQTKLSMDTGDSYFTNQDGLKELEIKQPVTQLSQVTTLPSSRKSDKHSLQLYMNGYLLSLFVKSLKYSECYRKLVIKNFETFRNVRRSTDRSSTSSLLKVRITLTAPCHDVLDFKWNERLDRMLVERRELDHTMSWFSTLGGAFSALGEEFQHCAEMAGKISLHQMRIALHLGDPLTVARCKLYLALSQMQRGRLKLARRIVEAQYSLARTSCVRDERLVRMCHGVWAKLKYTYVLRSADRRRKRQLLPSS